jgi:hypothetical protein
MAMTEMDTQERRPNIVERYDWVAWVVLRQAERDPGKSAAGFRRLRCWAAT